MNRTNPHVIQLTQRDNIHPFTEEEERAKQCMVASFTMMMNWLGTLLNLEQLTKQYNEHLHLTLVGSDLQQALRKNPKYANLDGEQFEKIFLPEFDKYRYFSNNHASMCNTYLKNLKTGYQFKQANLNLAQCKEIVETKNSPVIVGTMMTNHGHIVVFDGLWQDPYGHAEHEIRPYNAIYKNENGSDSDYPDSFARSMIFRTMKQLKTGNKNGKPAYTWITDKINQTRPCWYLEKIS